MDSTSVPATDLPAPTIKRLPLLILAAGIVLVLIIFLVIKYVVVPYEKPRPAVVPAHPEVAQEADSIPNTNGEVVPPALGGNPAELTTSDITQNGLDFHTSALTKIIDGRAYAFVPDKISPQTEKRLAIRDDSGVFQLPTARFLQVLGYYIDSRTTDFWIDEKDLSFFTVEGTIESFDRSATILQLQFEPRGNDVVPRAKKLLAFIPQQDEMSGIFIVDSRADKQSIVVQTGMGDGCGTKGTIWVLNTQTLARTEALSYGGGCAPGPGYGGVYKDGRLIAIEQEPMPESNAELWNGNTITSLYLIDPFTLEKEVLTTDSSQFAEMALIQNTTTDFNEISPAEMDGNIIFAKSFSSTQGPRSALFRYDVTKKQLVAL